VPSALAAAPVASTTASVTPPSASGTGAPSSAVSLGDIGSGGPGQLLATSSSGAWVALCDGEPKIAKLVIGSGSGVPIDELLAQDASGRYVVMTSQGVAELLDSTTSSRVNLTELGADVRRLRADYAEHRTLSFDPSGRYLAYVRKQGAAALVVVRKLETGSEQTFATGAGEVLRLRLSADARFVTFEALREDTNKNGKLDFPAPEEPPRKNSCEKPGLPRFRSFAYQGRGDTPTRAVGSLTDGSVHDVPDLVTPLGQSLLVRESDGSLRLEHAGKRAPFAPASCAARVLFADAERGLVLASCTPPPPKKTRGVPLPPASGKREVWLFGSGLAKSLQSELYETNTDRDSTVGTRLVPLYPGSEASLLDLERREVLPLAAGSRVLTTNGAAALVWRDSDLYRYDAETKHEERLAHGVLKNPDLLQAGSAVLLSPFVVVGVSAPALESPPHALALSSGGFVLTGNIGENAESSNGGFQGPLHWVDARLPPPDGPSR
jgi:hypothetical protein